MLKVEKKISFTVAGIEFQNLKTAQFFARAVNLHNQDSSSDSAHVARDLLDIWAAATHEECEDEELVEVVMGLQMPKPARKPTPKKKNVQALAGDPQTKEFWDEHHIKNQFLEPAPGEQEEVSDGLDTTFALKA